MDEKRFKVIIRTPNRFFVVNRVAARSPLTFVIKERDLNAIRTKIKYEGITDYSIEEMEENEKISPTIKVVKSNEKIKETKQEDGDTIVEEDEKSKTILEELLGD